MNLASIFFTFHAKIKDIFYGFLILHFRRQNKRFPKRRIFQFVSFSPVLQNLPTQMSLKCDCKSVPQNCSFAVFTLIFIEMFQVLDLKVLFFWHVFNGTFERFFSFTRGAEEERWNEGSNCTDWFLQITSREYQNGGKKRNF